MEITIAQSIVMILSRSLASLADWFPPDQNEVRAHDYFGSALFGLVCRKEHQFFVQF
jgi:hypothetical protein